MMFLFLSIKIKAMMMDVIRKNCTVVPGFRVLGFSALPVFRALKAGDSLVGT